MVLEEQAQLLEGQGAMLRKAAGVIGSGAVGFEVARIELWRTPVADKSLRSWTCVATAALGG